MKVLILSQAVTLTHLEIILRAFPEDTKVTLLTGENLELTDPRVEIYKVTCHNAANIKSRFVCWLKYWNDVKRWSKLHEKDFNLIFATSNPPLNSFLGYSLKKKMKCPFIYMNWDIYPQIVEETYNRNILVKMLCKVWHYFNNFVYPRIDQILTIGNIMEQSIRDKVKKPINIEVIPIGTNTSIMKPINKCDNVFLQNHKELNDKFIVLYSGKMGYGHNIQLILKTSSYLREIPEIHFVFIGHGPGYKIVQKYISDTNSRNVSLFPLQNRDLFPYSMSSGDIGVVSQEYKLAHLFLPSKVYDMMAVGLPIIGICSGNDDLSELIQNYKIGEIFSDGDAKRMSEYIYSLYMNKDAYNHLSNRARKTAVEKYDENKIIELYRTMFEKLL